MAKLKLSDREQISNLLNKGVHKSVIANKVNKNPSTIYRELGRLSGLPYSYSLAQEDASSKAKNSKKHKKISNEELKNYISRKLSLGWSPEQISKRLEIDYPYNKNMRASHECIYQFIYNTENLYEKTRLIKLLRRRKKRRYSRKGKTEKRGKIPNAVSIKERPIEADDRTVIGHWEGDLIIGKNHKSAIGTLVERSSRYTIIFPISKRRDMETINAFIQAFEKLPKELKKSLTYDRGKEMTCHEVFTEKTQMPVFFADPHSPWQRGTNENTNGLIRNFFPKRTDFSKYSVDDYSKVEALLNSRPRKILGFKTPYEKLRSLLVDA